MTRWKIVVFDLDDTLFPEREFVESGFGAVAEWIGRRFAVDPADVLHDLLEMHLAGIRGNSFDLWLAEHAIDECSSADLVEVYRAHTPRIHPFSGIRGLLRDLRRGSRLGLVSDGYLEVQQRKLTALQLSELFDAVVFSDEFGRNAWKPSIRPFQEVLNRLGADAADAVYVADNCKKDFVGARAAGMSTIWARHSEGQYALIPPEAEAYAADLTVDTIPQLASVLDGGLRLAEEGAA